MIDILTQKQKFKAVFESLLRADAKFLPCVQYKLNHYGLCDIELFEILGDVYLRGINAIEKGQTIKNPQAWCRTVAQNVIIDKMRNRYKHRKRFIELDAIEYTDDIEYEIASQNVDEDAYLDKQILLEKLLKVRDELNLEDKMIFDLRFEQDLSWEDVRKHLARSGIQLTTATLRKRGGRIKERLQQLFLTKD